MPQALDLNIELHSNQYRVRNDKSRYRVLVAGRRFGKTTLAIDELIEHALQNDKPCWYVAPTYKQAKMIAWSMLLNKLPRDIIEHKNEVDLIVKLVTGGTICLKGADNEDSLRGVGLAFVVLDEYAMMKPNVWYEIIRPMLTDTKGRALFIGTPQGKNALWELFMKGQRKEDNFSSYRFSTLDNPFIDPEEVDLAKKELPDRYYKQEYLASFEDYVGLIYPEFNKNHIIEPIYLDKSLNRIASIDPAISGTTCILKCAINEDGVLYIYDEYYEANKRVSEVVDSVKDDNIKSWFIDPASASRNINRDGKLYSLFNEYSDNGIYCLTAENDVESGINRVGEYFKSNKIKIFNTCKNLIYELERYHWSERPETVTGEPKPTPYKSLDHACDALRYIVMSRYPKANKEKPQIPRGSVAWFELQDELKEKDWRKRYA